MYRFLSFLGNWRLGVEFFDRFGEVLACNVSLQFECRGQQVVVYRERLREELEFFWAFQGIQFVRLTESQDISVNLVSQTF